jgi:hypothetical protein
MKGEGGVMQIGSHRYNWESDVATFLQYASAACNSLSGKGFVNHAANCIFQSDLLHEDILQKIVTDIQVEAGFF